MRSPWIRVGPKSNISVLTREEKGRRPAHGRAVSEAETGGMQPQAKEAGGHQKPEETRKERPPPPPPPEPSEGAQPLVSARSPGLCENTSLGFCKAPQFVTIWYSHPRKRTYPMASSMGNATTCLHGIVLRMKKMMRQASCLKLFW